MTYMGRKMYTNSLNLQVYGILKQREEVRKISKFTWNCVFHVPKDP